ncbi:MAG: glycine--tRNA ligase subunit alpha, partial [Candidatus Eisenbacteria sp.]|nr:glycine--tRNA ligase subunit alpha [Candidatus Eisenbacteria bacterium]
FTYFQQAGGVELPVTSAEITYGLGRLATFLQGVDSFFELEWAPGLSFGELQKGFEVEFSRFNFDEADIPLHRELFDKYESEAVRLLALGLLAPGYDYVLKCSHAFNVLDARGAISVTERTGYITRVRKLARKAALLYTAQREELGHPLLPGGVHAENGSSSHEADSPEASKGGGS